MQLYKFAPGVRNGFRGHLVFGLSVCLWNKNFNLIDLWDNFRTIRDRDIFGIHALHGGEGIKTHSSV